MEERVLERRSAAIKLLQSLDPNNNRLEVNFCYRVASGEEIFWLAHNERQSKKSDSYSMSLTTLQRIYSVLNFKSRHESLHGAISYSDLLRLGVSFCHTAKHFQ